MADKSWGDPFVCPSDLLFFFLLLVIIFKMPFGGFGSFGGY